MNTTIFNLASIINESQNFVELKQSTKSENYLSTSIMNLSEMNTSLNNALISLYTGINEAESTREENNQFAKYFKAYMDIIKENTRKLSEELNRFIINVDTFIDANTELLGKVSPTLSMDEEAPSLNLVKFENLDNNDIPKVSPYKVFKKEYRFLGKMLQDLGSNVSDTARVKIITSIYNNLVQEIETDWLDNLVCTISGGECHKGEFADTIYKKFVPGDSESVVLTTGKVQQAKLELLNYKELVEGVSNSVNDFIDEVNMVANELGALLFRNEDYMLDIKTDEDGIADKKYRLTEYSYNQFDQFMKIKANQLTEICNLYTIAISIKMDCIAKYLAQNKTVIETVVYKDEANAPADGAAVNTTPDDASVDDMPSDDTSMDSGADTDMSGDDSTTVPDDASVEDAGTDDSTDADLAPENNEPEYDPMTDDTDTSGATGDTSTDDSQGGDVPVPEEDQKVEAESYLFEADMFLLERVLDEMNLHETLYMTLTEDATPTKASVTSSTNIKNFIKKILDMLKQKVQSFLANITNNYDTRITANKKKEAQLRKITDDQIPKDWTIQAVDFGKLSNLNIVPYSEGDNELLADTTKYFNTKYANYNSNKDQSDKKAIKNNIIGSIIADQETPFTSKDIDAGLSFILKDFNAQKNKINSDLKFINTNATNAEKLTSMNASADMSSYSYDMMMYFNEADGKETPAQPAAGGSAQQQQQPSGGNGTDAKPKENTDGKTEEKKTDNSTALKNYVTVSTTVLTAKMGLLITVFKKYDRFFNALIPDGKTANDQQQNQNNANDQQQAANNNTQNNNAEQNANNK